jgi:hypothetical protein
MLPTPQLRISRSPHWHRVLLGVLVLCPGFVSGAAAQMLHLDPIPWSIPADSTSSKALIVEVSRFEESKFGWAGDRLMLTLVLPAGEDATTFVRIPYVMFDRGDVSLFSRWPWVQGEAEVDTFWSERRVSSFGQIEVGANGRADWPLLGGIHYGGAIGLPVGTDRLYPLSSISVPIRVEGRKDFALDSRFHLALSAGYLYNLDSGSDLLDATAFPGGWRWGSSLSLLGGRNRRVILDYDHQNRDGRRSQLAGIQCWLPWSKDGSWSARVERQLAGSLDRYATWRFVLAWRFGNPLNRPGSEEPES